MADLDVSDVLDDPDFVDTGLQLRVAEATVSDQGLAQATPGWLLFAGVVIPDGGQDLIQTPEGDAVTGDITIYTRRPLTSGDADRSADLIQWNGAAFKVVNAQPWLYGSGYTRAVCKQMDLNPSAIGATEGDSYAGALDP